MSASGTLFLQTFVFLPENRILRVCQETRDFFTHGRRRKLPASGPSKTFSATVAGAWPGTKKPVTGSPTDCTQIRFCTAGESSPQRRAVRKPQTHAKTCQTQLRTPAIREIVVAAAHAEGKTAVITTTRTAPKDASQAKVANQGKVASRVKAASRAEAASRATAPKVANRGLPPASPSVAPCRLPSS